MMRCAWSCSLVGCLVLLHVADAAAGPPATPDSVSEHTVEPPPAAPTDSSGEASAGDGTRQPDLSTESGQDADPEQAASSDLTFTCWDFELHVKAFQHEPAGKNLDEFEAKLRFAALLPHASQEPQAWTGFGEMSAVAISRAANSYQAPHRPVRNFHVLADSFWDREGNAVSVIIHPQDAVTYSLTTGQVLGTTGVLKLMLADATCEGLQGTMLAFSLPISTTAPAEFQCRFDTSAKHVCWYEGQATLKVLRKYTGEFSTATSGGETAAADETPGEDSPKGQNVQTSASAPTSSSAFPADRVSPRD